MQNYYCAESNPWKGNKCKGGMILLEINMNDNSNNMNNTLGCA